MKFGFEVAEKWYDHNAEQVLERGEIKILWDMKLHTDKVLEHSHLDIIVIDKKDRVSKLIDVACPFDTRIVRKEAEKMIITMN